LRVGPRAGTLFTARGVPPPLAGPQALARPYGIPFSPHHDEDERAERQDGGGTGEANGAHDHETVPAGFGIVVVAIEPHLIDRCADLARRCVDERESQIARTVIDAEEITRDPPLRRQDNDPCGMGELPEALVP